MAVEIVGKVVWPCVVLAVVLVLVAIFKPELRRVIGRMNRVRFRSADVTFEYGSATVDTQAPSETMVCLPDAPAADDGDQHGSEDLRVATHDFSKPGNLFWLGNDLLWTVDLLLRGGPARDIRWGLVQCLHHARELEFHDDEVERPLFELANAPEVGDDDYWSPARRNLAASRLSTIAGAVGRAVEVAQPLFVPYAPGADPNTRTPGSV